MQLFSREKQKVKEIAQETELQPLDPIAVCLALWLGLMVGVFGFFRLMEDAAQRTKNALYPAISAQTMRPITPGG